MDKINRIQNQGIASTEARRQGALRLLRFAAALAGDSTPLLRLKRLGMAERFLSARTRPETTTPLFPRKQPFFGSARSGPGRGTRRSEPLTARTDLESSKGEGKGASRRSPEASEPPHHGQDQDWVFPVHGVSGPLTRRRPGKGERCSRKSRGSTPHY